MPRARVTGRSNSYPRLTSNSHAVVDPAGTKLKNILRRMLSYVGAVLGNVLKKQNLRP